MKCHKSLVFHTLYLPVQLFYLHRCTPTIYIYRDNIQQKVHSEPGKFFQIIHLNAFSYFKSLNCYTACSLPATRIMQEIKCTTMFFKIILFSKFVFFFVVQSTACILHSPLIQTHSHAYIHIFFKFNYRNNGNFFLHFILNSNNCILNFNFIFFFFFTIKMFTIFYIYCLNFIIYNNSC